MISLSQASRTLVLLPLILVIACGDDSKAPQNFDETCDLGGRALCADALVGVVRADDPQSLLCFAVGPYTAQPYSQWLMLGAPWANGTTHVRPQYDGGRVTSYEMECSHRGSGLPITASVEWDPAGRPGALRRHTGWHLARGHAYRLR